MAALQRYNRCLVPQIDLCKPKTIVEVGTWDGGNATKMIKAAQKHNPDIIYYGFDIFEGISHENREKELHNKRVISKQDAENRLTATGATIKLHVGYTTDTLPVFEPDQPIDFAYIDGGHSLDTVENDWNSVKKHMHENTVVLFDDYYVGETSCGCFNLICELDESDEYNVEVLFSENVQIPPDAIGVNVPELNIGIVKVTKK
ncbi:class I SAM-dependent methyltransferase [bacterium]|nr:class I SAM-dependent methyltransferase [bacterium]